MIWNEMRKIWKAHTLILVVAVGVTLMYSWVIGQMNLKNLPLFETVELAIGKQLKEKYGDELDAEELEEIGVLYEEARQDLNQKVAERYPEIIGEKYKNFEEFEEDCCFTITGSEDEKEDKAMWDTYCQMVEEFAYEYETCTTYYSIRDALNENSRIAQRLDLYENKILVERIYEITQKDAVSTLPSQVTMNMHYVMSNYAWILIILAIIIVLPYLMNDNRRNVYPVMATTKTGRRLIRYQIIAALLSVCMMLGVCDVAFYICYRVMTSYEPFNNCIVPWLWFDWTWQQYFWIQLLMINIGVLALSMSFLFVSSLCKNIVGFAVATCLCWGIGSVLSLYYFDQLFQCDYGFDSYIDMKIMWPYLDVVVEIVLLLIGIVLLGVLYQKRMKADILE